MDPYQAASHVTCLSGSSSSVGSIPSTLQSKSMREKMKSEGSVSFKGKLMEELDRCNKGLEDNEKLTKQINEIKSCEKKEKDVENLKFLQKSLSELSDCVKIGAVEESQYQAVKDMRLRVDQKVCEAKIQLEKLLRKKKKEEQELLRKHKELSNKKKKK